MGYTTEQWRDSITINEHFDRLIKPEQIIYYESNCDYSWGEILLVLCVDGRYYLQEDFDIWELTLVTEDEALQAMEEFEQKCRENLTL